MDDKYNSLPNIYKTKKEEKKHKCHYPDCNAIFNRPYRLELHLKKHLGEVSNL